MEVDGHFTPQLPARVVDQVLEVAGDDAARLDWSRSARRPSNGAGIRCASPAETTAPRARLGARWDHHQTDRARAAPDRSAVALTCIVC